MNIFLNFAFSQPDTGSELRKLIIPIPFEEEYRDLFFFF